MENTYLQVYSRKKVLYADLNGSPTHNMFGGVMLLWIDEQSAIYAECQLNSNMIVTKAMSKIDFVSPATLNDTLTIGFDVVRIGKTSITISCEVRNKNSDKLIIKIDEITFVKIDENGKPTNHNVTEKRLI